MAPWIEPHRRVGPHGEVGHMYNEPYRWEGHMYNLHEPHGRVGPHGKGRVGPHAQDPHCRFGPHIYGSHGRVHVPHGRVGICAMCMSHMVGLGLAYMGHTVGKTCT